MLIIIFWSLIGLITLFYKRVPISIRFVLLLACTAIILQQIELMEVIK